MALVLGSTGDAVLALQVRLTALGLAAGSPDGIFGDATLAAVKAYQSGAGLDPDGEAGPLTLAALAAGPAAAIAVPAPAGAGGNFYTDVIGKSPLFHSTGRCGSLALLEPVTRAAVSAILVDAKAAGTPLMIFETFRSKERQALLYDQGATQLRNVGVHHYGLAADLVKDIGGQPSWKGSFDFLRVLANKHGLISGADWGSPGVRHTFIDADHVQRCTIADQDPLFAGTWYPAAS